METKTNNLAVRRKESLDMTRYRDSFDGRKWVLDARLPRNGSVLIVPQDGMGVKENDTPKRLVRFHSFDVHLNN
jgi:hypothetical protein